MHIDAIAFRSIAASLLPRGTTLSAEEGVAVIHAAQLAGGVDFDEDPSERPLLKQIVRHVTAIAELAPDDVPPASPLPIDAEERLVWIDRLASRLQAPGVADLAYVTAWLVTVGDLQLAPIESAFLEELRLALEISRDRAGDLAVTISSMVTPGIESEARI